MRKITFGGAISLDNYLARPDDGVDWLQWSDEAASIMGDYWTTIDTVLMGRKTFEVALRKGPQGSMPGITGYVFSRTLTSLPDKNAVLVRENAAEVVREMKSAKGKDICLMGGGSLAKTLFEADLIDEIGFNIHPILLGSGIPVYHVMNRETKLELMKCKPFKNGCVYVQYRVKR